MRRLTAGFWWCAAACGLCLIAPNPDRMWLLLTLWGVAALFYGAYRLEESFNYHEQPRASTPKRFLRAALLALAIPLLAVIVLGLLLLLLPGALCSRYLPWNRRAMRRALVTFAASSPSARIRSVQVVFTSRDYCYVLVAPPGPILPPVETLYAVRYDSGEVREIVTTQFHRGITLWRFIEEFESDGATYPSGVIAGSVDVPPSPHPP